MKNETRNKLKPECVHCDKCNPKLLEGAGRSRTRLPNGQWSEETVCNMYEIICTLDGKSKGYIFSPYEDLEPGFCPKAIKERKSLFRKIF